MMLVGMIAFPSGEVALHGATVFVRIEDVTLADTPSKVLAETVMRDVNHQGKSLPFSIQRPSTEPGATVNLSVHVSQDGGGQISKGDYLTMQSYPLDPETSQLNVSVQQV